MTKDKPPLYLDAFTEHRNNPALVPGKSRRDWMDSSSDRYAYRCLPLTMANATGWELRCPFALEIGWNGGPEAEDISVKSPKGTHTAGLAQSHFKQGIVSFHTGYLFRTPPGWAVWCMGPPNLPKDGIYPLSGLVETDWLPFPFTMNWMMTRPGRVTFEKDEPFCFITLIEHGRLDQVEPKIKDIETEPELKSDYKAWNTSRHEFLEKLIARDPDTVEQGWQRHYMQAAPPSGKKPASHMTKRRLLKPKDLR